MVVVVMVVDRGGAGGCEGEKVLTEEFLGSWTE